MSSKSAFISLFTRTWVMIRNCVTEQMVDKSQHQKLSPGPPSTCCVNPIWELSSLHLTSNQKQERVCSCNRKQIKRLAWYHLETQYIPFTYHNVMTISHRSQSSHRTLTQHFAAVPLQVPPELLPLDSVQECLNSCSDKWVFPPFKPANGELELALQHSLLLF